MPRGVYAAASAMVAETRAVEVLAENLANVNTPGFRRSVPMRRDFAEVLAQRGQSPGKDATGVAPTTSYMVFRPGKLHETGSPFDLALTGDGFFRVRDSTGRLLLTRASTFATDGQGRLVTGQSWPVQGQGGDILLPPNATAVRVDPEGRVFASVPGQANESFVEQLRLASVAPADRVRLVTVSGQFFLPGTAQVGEATGCAVHQGYVEESNVEPLGELVSMIAAQRRYDAAQRALTEQVSGRDNYHEVLRGV